MIRDRTYFKQEIKAWCLLAFFGSLFGLIAPGFEQWYLAWIGLVPLLFCICQSSYPPQAFYRGLIFGYAYNLVYVGWILQFSPIVWPENIRSLYLLANTSAWILYSLQQGTLFGAFAFLMRWIPLTGGILAIKDHGTWRLPSALVLPLLWVLIFNKLANSQGSMALPWSLIEYSQYDFASFAQIASVIGGIGISAILVMTNVIVASLFANIFKKDFLKPLAFANKTSKLSSLFFAQCIIFGAIAYGHLHLQDAEDCVERSKDNKQIFSILQGNIHFAFNQVNSLDHWNTYMKLALQSPPGVCIWPEWSMPISISEYPGVFKAMDSKARQNNQDWIVGALDSDSDKNSYNASCMVGTSSDQNKSQIDVYRKQWLVPFGEYSPRWLLNSPLGGLCGTLTPRRIGYKAADSTTLFTSKQNKIVPLICCELISPELASRGTRAGGGILVDCSNTMWFQTKLLGEQSFAVCAMRAIENHRFFVFGTSIGPSAFIDWHGKILSQTAIDKSCTLTSEIFYDRHLTPFSRWFR
ncbi:apolipoprotein N-acyltransferase [bacterium]|nr:apolipoprotein N-acyltransferase [bacterium]